MQKPAASKTQQRVKIAALMSDFIALGGQVKQCKPGAITKHLRKRRAKSGQALGDGASPSPPDEDVKDMPSKVIDSSGSELIRLTETGGRC